MTTTKRTRRYANAMGARAYETLSPCFETHPKAQARETLSHLATMAGTIQRLAVEECSGDNRDSFATVGDWRRDLEQQQAKARARVTTLVESLPLTVDGPILPSFDNDCRGGHALQLTLPKGSGRFLHNSFGRDSYLFLPKERGRKPE